MSGNENVTTSEIELPDGYVLRTISAPWGAAAGIVIPSDKAVVGFGGSLAYEGPLPVGFPSNCGASHVDTPQGFSSANLDQSSADTNP